MNMIKNLPIYLTLFLLSGCITNDDPETEIILSQSRQKTYLSQAKPPQQFGFEIVSADDGITYFGRARLHHNQSAVAEISKEAYPIISVRGHFRRARMNALVDFSSPSSWLEFSQSQKFSAKFLGINNDVMPYRGGNSIGEANAYASVISQLRIDQLFMENVPFYTRMAEGSLGPLARKIQSPKVDAVLGYDNLRNFEFIQMDLSHRRILFSSTKPYTPNDELLVDTVKILNLPGYGLAVAGSINNQPWPILLDFAGNYHFSRGDVNTKSTAVVGLGKLSFENVPTLLLPRHNAPPRAGRKMLSPYVITICYRQGVVYFERPPK